MLAITGITGQVGGAVARAALAAGMDVRAVLRDPGKAAHWAARGCDVAVADMTDARALTEAFAGADAVFVLIPPVFDPAPGFPEVRRVIAAVAEAVTRARPGRLVCLSTIGAQVGRPNLLNQLGLVEAALGALDLPVGFVRAAWFMENSAAEVRRAIASGVMRSHLQPLDRPVPMVATADVGAVAAELLLTSWTGRRVIELEGPARVSPAEIAATLSALSHRPIRAEAVPRAEWDAAFRAEGARNPTPRARMIDGFNEGWIEFEGGGSESRTGPTPLETVLRALVARG